MAEVKKEKEVKKEEAIDSDAYLKAKRPELFAKKDAKPKRSGE